MPRPRGDVGFDCLGERKRNVGAMLRVSQQGLVIDIADITRLEQDRRYLGAPQNVERGEAVRLGPQGSAATTAWMEGWSMSVEEAIDYALKG